MSLLVATLTARSARRFLSFAALVAIAVIAISWSAVPLDADRPLADRVVIRRDTFGVPHIVAETEAAAGFGLRLRAGRGSRGGDGPAISVCTRRGGEVLRIVGARWRSRRSADGQHRRGAAGARHARSHVPRCARRLRGRLQPVCAAAPRHAAPLGHRDQQRRRSRADARQRRDRGGLHGDRSRASAEVPTSVNGAGSIDPLAGPARRRRGHAGRRRVERARAVGTQDRERSADSAGQSAPQVAAALLGSAREGAGPAEFLRLHARGLSVAARGVQRSAWDTCRRTTIRTPTTYMH